MKNSKGFTLLEILVVVGIIVVLVGLVTTSYSTAQRKVRDTRRKSDLKQIQDSMEQYYSVCNYEYPTSIDSSSQVVCLAPSMMIMPTIPVDPKSGSSYSCTSCPGDSYTICTNSLESESPTGYCLNNLQ